MISAIIVKFDQIRKIWWRISFAEILEVGKKFFRSIFGKENDTIWGGFTQKKSRELLENLLKQLFFLDYELIITNSAYGLVGYIYQHLYGTSSKNNC